MKHVNGDMEDLFRRASAKYPLRTDSADWDRLAAALDKDPGPPSDTDKDDKRRRRAIFWWWLLLPLAVGAGIYSWRASVRPSAHLSKAVMQGTVTQPGGTEKAGAQGGTSVQPGNASTADEAGSAGGTRPTATAGTRSATAGARSAGAGDEAGSATGPGLAGSTADRTRLRGTATGGTGLTTTGRKRSTGSTAGRMRPAGAAAGTGGISGGNVTSDNLFDAANKNMTGKKGGYGNSASGEAGEAGVARDAVASGINLKRVPTAGSYSLVVDVKAPAARKDSSAKKATAKSKGGHGYIGLTGAPDLSTVKMQATKGVGTTWGLVLGYAFNSHWAVESGVYLDRKKYYSAGEYFKDPEIPSGTTLESVNGICNMWEVPLNVRYNFNPGSRITWFATTGFSSYFMTKQKYAGQEENYNGSSWTSTWIDSAHSNYLFSIINISGGFEQRIGKIGNLRIEPYLRIPLSGIGTGRLPIMSAGLNIGITHQLW
jgi:Outer membrane protein beta-barrel domain